MSSKTASFETLKLHMSTLAATVLHADDNTPRAQCCLLESRHIHGADNQTPWRGFKCQWHPCRPYRAGIRHKKVLGSTPPNPIGSTPAVPRPRFMNIEPATRDHEWESTRLGSFEPRRNTYTSLMRGRVGGTERNIAHGKQRQELRAFSQTAKLQAVAKQLTGKGQLLAVSWH